MSVALPEIISRGSGSKWHDNLDCWFCFSNIIPFFFCLPFHVEWVIFLTNWSHSCCKTRNVTSLWNPYTYCVPNQSQCENCHTVNLATVFTCKTSQMKNILTCEDQHLNFCLSKIHHWLTLLPKGIFEEQYFPSCKISDLSDIELLIISSQNWCL